MCIVSLINVKDKIYLAKNRDRNYKPTISIVHTQLKGVEVVFLYDYDTGWSEGMNEYGIGVVNSALAVGFDENEKKLATKAGTKSKDGKRIIKSLTYSNIKEVCNSLMKYEGGVRGHTIVSNGYESYVIESTSKHDPIIKKIKPEIDYIVRTNHGFSYSDAGYTRGKDYTSSKIRKASAERVLDKITDPKYILPSMRHKFYNYDSNLNMNIDNKLSTTSQMLLDLNNLVFNLDVLQNDINTFNGVVNKLSTNYQPKIKIRYNFIDV